MKGVATALRGIVRLLLRANQPFAVVGGIAVSSRTEPRFTRDVDLAIAVRGDSEAEQVVSALRGHGFRLKAVIEQKKTGRLATVRLEPAASKDTPVVIDLLFASSGIEPEVVAAATTIEVFPRVRVPVAQVGHLIALKLLSRDDRTRPQDSADLRALLAVARAQDLATAKAAVELISQRGFARRRNLRAALRTVASRQRPDLAGALKR